MMIKRLDLVFLSLTQVFVANIWYFFKLLLKTSRKKTWRRETDLLKEPVKYIKHCAFWMNLFMYFQEIKHIFGSMVLHLRHTNIAVVQTKDKGLVSSLLHASIKSCWFFFFFFKNEPFDMFCGVNPCSSFFNNNSINKLDVCFSRELTASFTWQLKTLYAN